MSDGVDGRLGLLQTLVQTLLNDHNNGVRLDAQSKLLSDIIEAAVPLVAAGSTLGGFARNELARIGQQLGHDPYLTLRVAEFIRSRIVTCVSTILQFDAVVADSQELPPDRRHARGLPSHSEEFCMKFIARGGNLIQVFTETSATLGLMLDLIPSATTVAGETLPNPATGASKALQSTSPSQTTLTSSQTGSSNNPAASDSSASRAFLSHRRKVKHIASAEHQFSHSVRYLLGENLKQLDLAGKEGIYDADVMRVVARQIRADIDDAIKLWEKLITLAKAPVGWQYKLPSFLRRSEKKAANSGAAQGSGNMP